MGYKNTGTIKNLNIIYSFSKNYKRYPHQKGSKHIVKNIFLNESIFIHDQSFSN